MFGARPFATPSRRLRAAARHALGCGALVLCLSTAGAPSAHGGVWGGIRSGAGIFVGDLWYMVSSPARLDRQGWLQTAGVVGVGAVLYAYDQEILDAFQRSKGNDVYDAVLYLGRQWEPVGNMGNTSVYFAGAAALGWATSVEPLAVIPSQILESQVTSGLMRNAAKFVVGRRRPRDGEGPYSFEPGTGASFPSGHASNAFQLAGILTHHANRTRFGRPVSAFTHFAAASIALERVDSESHWPSDVYVGAVMGSLTSRTIIRRWRERAGGGDGFPEKLRVSLAPAIGRSAVGLRVVASF